MKPQNIIFLTLWIIQSSMSLRADIWFVKKKKKIVWKPISWFDSKFYPSPESHILATRLLHSLITYYFYYPFLYSLIILYILFTADEHDLLSIIKIPFDDPATQYFASGADGFPAYGLLPGSDVKAPYRLTFPEILYKEFALVGTVKVNSEQGGFVFALVNPLETVSSFVFSKVY